MNNLSLHIPDSQRAEVRQLAEQEGVSINQFIAYAAAEKLSALGAACYFGVRLQ